MIHIIRNINFDNWIDVKMFGQLIDNVKTEAQALALAKTIQSKQKEETETVLPILNRLKKSKKKFA